MKTTQLNALAETVEKAKKLQETLEALREIATTVACTDQPSTLTVKTKRPEGNGRRDEILDSDGSLRSNIHHIQGIRFPQPSIFDMIYGNEQKFQPDGHNFMESPEIKLSPVALLKLVGVLTDQVREELAEALTELELFYRI